MPRWKWFQRKAEPVDMVSGPVRGVVKWYGPTMLMPVADDRPLMTRCAELRTLDRRQDSERLTLAQEWRANGGRR